MGGTTKKGGTKFLKFSGGKQKRGLRFLTFSGGKSLGGNYSIAQTFARLNLGSLQGRIYDITLLKIESFIYHFLSFIRTFETAVFLKTSFEKFL